jgi:hypothetical protein
MSNNIKVNKPPVWYTSVLVIAGLVLFIAGFLTAKHFLETIGDGAAYIFIVMFPLPMMLGGFYAVISALRQKIVVDKDKITFVDGVIGEEIINREDVDAYVLRQNAGTLEVKRANKPDKEVFSIVAESDESLKEWLKPEKAVSEFLPDRQFNPSLYPKVYKPSIIPKLMSFLFFGILAQGLWLFFTKQPYDYSILAFLIFMFICMYFLLFQYAFGYKVILHADKVEVKIFPFTTTIKRDEIVYFRFSSFRRNTAILLITKRNKYVTDTTEIDSYIVTHGEFNRDRDFIDWFNTLEADTDFPIPRLREEVK